MASGNFTACHAVTHRWEHGYSNHPSDPGGATQDGVTQRVYDAWRRQHGLMVQPVRLLSGDERLSIYRGQYWSAVNGEALPPGIDLAVYDFGVNSGPTRAIKYLQAALGVATDGHVGNVTVRAAQDAWERGDAGKVIVSIMDGREAFLRKLPTFSVFGKGWINRTRDVRKEALAMAGRSRIVGGSPIAAKTPARPPSVSDAYQPDKASEQPPKPVSAAKQMTQTAVAVGTAGGAASAAATQTKDLFGDTLSPTVLLAVVVVVMVVAGVVAWFQLRNAEVDA